MGAFAGWFAIGLAFYLVNIQNSKSLALGTVIGFFSAGTTLANILVALCLTFFFIKPESDWSKFFSRAKIVAAIAVYISACGLLYNVLLRPTRNPVDWGKVADELLHLILPLWFLLYWLLFAAKKELKWKDALFILFFPLLYTVVILIRGVLFGIYPYSFIDINKLGFDKFLFNISMFAVVFSLLSLLFITIAKIMSGKHKTI